LFGRKDGAVTVTNLNGEDIFGSNSTSPTYRDIDLREATDLRDRSLLSTLNWRLATTTGSIRMTASIMLKQLSCCEQQEKMVGLSLD